ncbi:MAG: hypothetical protein L3J99_07240 [Thermoplasmata archaeon]|nr:hypothetical protein [Thermoplasmata archaeon]
MPRWPPPVYRMSVEFAAPIRFVFRWCTDYQPGDDRRSGDRFERRILSRSARRVLYEDLWWERDGWRWRRNDVTLQPPDRWSSDSIGNVREAQIEYRLTPLAGGRTRLNLRMLRRPTRRVKRQPPKRELEEELIEMWGKYRRSLEADYRRSRPGRTHNGAHPRSRRR